MCNIFIALPVSFYLLYYLHLFCYIVLDFANCCCIIITVIMVWKNYFIVNITDNLTCKRYPLKSMMKKNENTLLTLIMKMLHLICCSYMEPSGDTCCLPFAIFLYTCMIDLGECYHWDEDGSVSDLVDASAPALQDDDFQQLGSVTLCVLACIYGQHLQQAQSQKPSRRKKHLISVKISSKMKEKNLFTPE